MISYEVLPHEYFYALFFFYKYDLWHNDHMILQREQSLFLESNDKYKEVSIGIVEFGEHKNNFYLIEIISRYFPKFSIIKALLSCYIEFLRSFRFIKFLYYCLFFYIFFYLLISIALLCWKIDLSDGCKIPDIKIHI